MMDFHAVILIWSGDLIACQMIHLVMQSVVLNVEDLSICGGQLEGQPCRFNHYI